jgi:hypothetical protein
MAAIQYTFTHKQYTEQHNETEYTEENIYNNKNTKYTKLNRSTPNITTVYTVIKRGTKRI